VDEVVLATVGGVAAVVAVGVALLSRYEVGGPNEALVVSGRRGDRVVLGGTTFVWPFLQRLQVMDLSARRIPVGVRGALSATGIRCDLEGVAVVKVAGTEEGVRAAAQRFLDQQEGITQFTQEVLAGSLRAVLGRTPVDQLVGDRAGTAAEVARDAQRALGNQGLALDTFQLLDIAVEGDYLTDLGRAEAARVHRDGVIAESRARQQSEQERLLAEEAIAISQRQLALKQAEIRAQVDAAQADAEVAGALTRAGREHDVLAERERAAERRAGVRDRELDAEVRKPADAERYRVEQAAHAARNAALLRADADKAATLARAEADAERLRLTGEAESSGILARGEAEAEVRRRHAEVMRAYGDDATLELVVGILPEVVRGMTEPRAIEQGIDLGSELTGVDIRALLRRTRTAPPTPVDATPAPAAPAVAANGATVNGNGNGRTAPDPA